ncbi:CBS domain-containing protein CBSX1, chloroplastic [Vitis vinifera]|uniref:CBS domain-containing protein CBSX1, chloroplastic n=1 Tax=Vitis vinifera TaxID=29760 RepID=A0A438KQQ9_VITVI|nr:CBS domain-containing protein CBSX1, chloroplastic [Vitis vinifera]
MDAILPPETLAVVGIRPAFASAFGSGSASFPHQMPCTLLFQPGRKPPVGSTVGSRSERISGLRRSPALAAAGTLMANSVPSKNGVYTVGDFMTRKEDLHVVKATTTVEEALEILVENRITGFPVIDDDWKLVGSYCSIPLSCWEKE